MENYVKWMIDKRKTKKMNRSSISDETTSSCSKYVNSSPWTRLEGGAETYLNIQWQQFPNLIKTIRSQLKNHKHKNHEENNPTVYYNQILQIQKYRKILRSAKDKRPFK